jgi:S-DNA-T family DNA segregation ATPase FtsK/SpoIIIE
LGCFRLADGPHLLIGGITGKGKSVIINQALYCSIAYHGDKVERYLIDFKYGIEANKFSKHVLVADDIEAALPICADLVRDMEKRANVLKKYNVEKWQDLPEEVRPHYKLLVIDEFAEISPDLEPDKDEKKIKLILMRCLVMLLQKGRAVGISVVICTQRPEREVVPGILKANLPWTMALQVRNRVNSEILLDNDKAVWLRGKGRCWIQTSDFEKEVQVPYLSGKSIRQKLANIPAYYSNYTNTAKSTKKLTQTTNKKVD